ncbi:hypothetical protein VTJ04DRAFT_7265 [Mycothermus thermophilus]|uniref:uncharacterized protein n=1 Tax=Humicola insolens TaxID=85995 RepID=UPI0037420AFF
MEKKRKLPPRAAARAEQAAKRRTLTPPQRSETPTPAPAPERDPTPVEEAPPPLPTSITPGKPLPTVESPQPDDLSNAEYQTVTESGVLAESLSRSRQKWTMDGIFEKYWSKPTKKKGVVIEEPNNPPKDSMMKLGQVTITVEPHVFEATMFAVKDPRPPPPPSSERPILQYGPPNGVLPPSTAPSPAPTPATPASAADPSKPPGASDPKPASTPSSNVQQPGPQSIPGSAKQGPPIPPLASKPVPSPRGLEGVLAPTPAAPVPTQPSSGASSQAPPPGQSPSIAQGPGAVNAAGGKPGQIPSASDPIILMLADTAGSDPLLRELMRRVATGAAPKHELERFQAIVDAITAEAKRTGVTAPPSAEKLIVDGRTVQYFANEVHAILKIVLLSNPKETGASLRPPPGSDPLVVGLVRIALDDAQTRDIVYRIATKKPQFADPTDLKMVLDKLHSKFSRDRERLQSASPAPTKPTTSTVNGHAAPAPSTAQQFGPPSQTSLRSKGPPPPPKPDISAVVFEFAGGTGDRYLFPKFSILEYVPTPQGQQVIASFLLVRKGSQAEYPMADPSLDYYQPLTIRLFTPSGRHLEHLARVVAPQDEVHRYMNDIMTRMTRAEYILLAMRLPRKGAAQSDEDGEAPETKAGKEKDKEKEKEKYKDNAVETPPPQQQQQHKSPTAAGPLKQTHLDVLWTKKATRPAAAKDSTSSGQEKDPADEQYQNFIASVSKKDA